MQISVPILFLAWLALPAVCNGHETAQTIYTGGTVLTMDDNLPRAEAVAVLNGRILAVGTTAELMTLRGSSTEVVDLGGHALLPGFVDAHGHVGGIGLQALSANLLAPPDGGVQDIASLQAELREFAELHRDRIDPVGAIVGFGYDDAQLAEQRHPTRDDLDAVSADMPVYVIHQSGHLGAANSRALAQLGFDEQTPDPAGGVIRRQEGSTLPNGVLEESAHFMALWTLMQSLNEQQSLAMFRAGVDMVVSFGYTTAQEGRATAGQVQMMRQAAAASPGLPIDVVAYPDVLVDRDFIADNVSADYRNRLRVGGAKLTIDGSPQGFTAWRDRPYYKPPRQYRKDYAGYPAVTSDQVFDSIGWAFDNGIQILTHANGEAAIDLFIAAIAEATEAFGAADRRPVLIHGQFLREDQVAALQQLGIFPSLFPMHTFYWGDWHRERTVGPVNADNISPTGWVLSRGMRFSTHHDAPVAFPDSMRVLDATVTRRSRSGDIIGPAHRVAVLDALKAMTIWPAYQHFEEASKGSIEAGKLADFVVLSNDPTAVDPETLDQLKVLRTIKEGKTVYDSTRAEAKPTAVVR